MGLTDIRTCFLGDSFTLGTGDPEGLGWVGRVLADEQGRGVNLTAYNLGIRGETGRQVAERAVAEVLPRIAGKGERRGVVFSFGANDLYLQRPLAETLAAAGGLLRWAGSEGFAAFVVGPPPADTAEIDAGRRALTLKIAAVARTHAAPFLDIGAAVVDWSGWHGEAAAGDGVHPGAEGYRCVADAFIAWQPWRDWLDG